jgi:ankyrin repeat protein
MTKLLSKISVISILSLFLLLGCKPVSLNMMEIKKDHFASELHEAAFEGDVKGIKKRIKYKEDPNLQDSDGNTPLHLAAIQKNHEAVEELLNNKSEVSIRNNLGNLPIHCASINGNCKSIDLLLKQDNTTIDTQNKLGQTPLHLAALNKQEPAFELLLSHNANPNIADNNGCPVIYTLLQVYYGDAKAKVANKEFATNPGGEVDEEVHSNFADKVLKSAPKLLDYRTAEDASLLHIAAVLGDIQVAEKLINLDNSLVNKVDNEGKTFLNYASYSGNVAFMEKFMNDLEDFDINVVNAAGMNKLHEAALAGKADMVKFLMEQGIRVDRKDNQGRTALHYACMSGSLVIVEELVEYIKLNERDSEGNTCLHIACEKRDYAIVKFLLERDAKPNITNVLGRTSLHIASIHGNTGIIDLLLRCDAKTQFKDNNKHTPLYYAIKGKHTDAITLLQRKGAALSDDEKEDGLEGEDKKREDLPAPDIIKLDKDTIVSILKNNNLLGEEKKDEALLWTLQNNQPEIAKWLIIKGGANVNAKDKDGTTPLYWAAYYGHTAVAEMLLKSGPNLNVKINLFGYTPLHLAASNGHTAVVELLLKFGANVDEKDLYGNRPLHYAALNGHTAVAEMLLKSDSNVDVKNNTGMTPLHLAAQRGYTVVAELLFKSGAQLNEENNDGKTPLKVAIEEKNNGVAKLLRRNGGRE